MKWYARLLVAVSAALAFGVVSALVLVVVDLYLTGHGQPSISQADISIPGISTKLSLSDLLFLAGIILPGLVTWLLLRPTNKSGRK
ncbi:hypothetical protein [Lysobacter sp. A289]